MSYQILWMEIARQDLAEIVVYLRQKSLQAALEALDQIEEKAQSLADLPNRGRPLPELHRFAIQHYRELVVSPYRLIYRVFDDDVVILGVFDSRRNLEDVILGRLLSF